MTKFKWGSFPHENHSLLLSVFFCGLVVKQKLKNIELKTIIRQNEDHKIYKILNFG